jgi:hypothetical protein
MTSTHTDTITQRDVYSGTALLIFEGAIVLSATDGVLGKPFQSLADRIAGEDGPALFGAAALLVSGITVGAVIRRIRRTSSLTPTP